MPGDAQFQHLPALCKEDRKYGISQVLLRLRSSYIQSLESLHWVFRPIIDRRFCLFRSRPVLFTHGMFSQPALLFPISMI